METTPTSSWTSTSAESEDATPLTCVQFVRAASRARSPRAAAAARGFKPGTYDDEFHRLDGLVDEYARSLPGFVRNETWTAPAAGTVNAVYYFRDRRSVALLARHPAHREAKAGVRRWYDGYRIVVSEVRAVYGDGRLPEDPTA